MKKQDAVIGVFDTHHEALEALQTLKKNDFPMNHVALVGKDEAVQDISAIHTWEATTVKGGLIGGVVGALTGITMVLIPEIGLIYVGGIVGGALLAGLEGGVLGALGGTIAGAVTGAKYGTEGEVEGKEDPKDAKKYKDMVANGKFLLIVHGPKKEVERGHEILVNHTKFSSVESQYANAQ